jgi:hypothetical protein
VLSQSDTVSKRGITFPNIIFVVLTFENSERKWKEKLKEWRFEKNISATDMNIIVAKAEKRVREEGKETVFFHGKTEITRERIEQFKRRKTTKAIEEALPSAGT